MDPHSSPLTITVRQTSAKTYGRSLSQRRRAPVPAAAPSAGSVIASTTGGGRARSGARSTSASTRQTSNGRLQLPEDLSSDDEEVESKRPRRGELSKGKEAPEESTSKRGASVLAKAPSLANAAKAESSSRSVAPPASRRANSDFSSPLSDAPVDIRPMLGAKRKASLPPSNPVRSKRGSLSKDYGGTSPFDKMDRKGKGRVQMEIVLPNVGSSTTGSMSTTPARNKKAIKPAQGLQDAERKVEKKAGAWALAGQASSAAARITGASKFPPAKPEISAQLPVLPASPKRRPPPSKPTLLNSPLHFRPSSPFQQQLVQTPPDILNEAEYFSLPSPSATGGAGMVPSSPLTPLSSSVTYSSPLRRALAPGSPTPRSTTPKAPQSRTLPSLSKPKPLQGSPRPTPRESASNLSALFNAHLISSPSKPSPSGSLGGEIDLASAGVDEEGGSLGKLVNLPAGRRKMGRMFGKSSTTPSLSTTPATRSPAGKSLATLFPSPSIEEPSTSKAVWDVPRSSPTGSRPDSPLKSPARPTLGKRRTYGGSSRSMLAAKDPTMTGEGEEEESESYAKLARKWGVDQGGEEGSFVDDTIELTTITSLRARGENQLFLDDLGYLLDGLRDSDLGVRRSSMIDLLRRMVVPEFRRSLKTYDQIDELWGILLTGRGSKPDMVLDASLITFLAILALDDRMLEPILDNKGIACCCFVKTVMSTNTEEDGFVLERKARAGKGKAKVKDRSGLKMMEELRKICLEVGVGGSEPSLRSSASSVFKHIVLDHGVKVDSRALLHDADVLGSVADSLRDEIADLPARLDNLEKGLPLTGAESPDLRHVQQCLVVLDGLVDHIPTVMNNLERDFSEMPTSLAGLLAFARQEVRTSTSSDDTSSASSCLLATLRFHLNLASLSLVWSTELLSAPSFLTTLARLIDHSKRNLDTLEESSTHHVLSHLRSSPHISRADDPSRLQSSGMPTSDATLSDIAADEPAVEIEILCLALGLLNKIVEKDGEAKQLVRETMLSATCYEERECALVCRCGDARSMLHTIVELYEEQRKGTSPEASYLAGYSLLLLSHFMDSSPLNSGLILSSLASMSTDGNVLTDQAKLSQLASELQVFSDVHQRFHDKLSSLAQTDPDQEDHQRGSTAESLGLDDEGLKEVKSGLMGLPSKEAGVGEVQRMVEVLRTIAREVGRA